MTYLNSNIDYTDMFYYEPKHVEDEVIWASMMRRGEKPDVLVKEIDRESYSAYLRAYGKLETQPFEDQGIVEKCLNRAAIRRKIGRKSDGKPDRIADTCEQAATVIQFLIETTQQQQRQILKLKIELADIEKQNEELLVENSEILTRMGW